MSTSTNSKYSSFLEFAPLLLLPSKEKQISLREARNKQLNLIKDVTQQVTSLVRAFVVLSICCNTLFVGIAFVLLPFLFWDAIYATTFLLVTISLYSVTYLGDPASNGRRKWKLFVDSFVIPDIANWFNGEVVIKHHLNKKKQYVFAFAPHGIMPLTALWMFHHEAWKKMFKGMDIVPLGSSVFHYAPIVRDIAMWAGTRQANKRTFVNSIREGKSVMIIPGGISEMKHSKSYSKTIVLDGKHKGFVKLAIQEGKDIVPVYSFGETKPFDLLHVPLISHLLLKYVKMPFPYFTGIGGVLQIPRRTKIVAVVGKPISVQKSPSPSDGEVDRIHREYYRSLTQLFEKHKEEYGHKDYKLHVLNVEL